VPEPTPGLGSLEVQARATAIRDADDIDIERARMEFLLCLAGYFDQRRSQINARSTTERRRVSMALSGDPRFRPRHGSKKPASGRAMRAG